MTYPVSHFRWYTMDRGVFGKYADDRFEKRACSTCHRRIVIGERHAVAATETAHHRFAGVQTLCGGCAQEVTP